MKEKRLRRNAEHLPAGVETLESYDENGKRHISLVATEGSANLRDIASLRSEDLKLGRVFASSQDISNQQLADIGVKTFLDLRVPQKVFTFAELRLLRSPSTREQEDPELHRLAESVTPRRCFGCVACTSASIRPCYPKRSLPPRCQFCAAALAQEKGRKIDVYHVELMQTSAKMSIFKQLPRGLKWKVLTAFSHKVSPKDIVEGNIGDEKPITYADLYKTLFDHSKKQFAQALRLFSRSDLYPILIHCQHGLDRTGMVVLMLTMLCHVPVKDVVHQYVESEASFQEDGPDEERVNRGDKDMYATSILQTIEYFLNKWGTAEQYALSIGLKQSEILAIKRNLLADKKPASMRLPDLAPATTRPSTQPELMQRST